MSTTTASRIVINAPATKVWEALTKPELVKQWQYGADLLTDWKVGGPIVYRSEWEGTVYEQHGTVLEIDADRVVKYALFAPHPDLEDKPENYFTMTYSLEEADGQTTLTIIQDDPREQATPAQADEGGNAVLDSLKHLVEGRLERT